MHIRKIVVAGSLLAAMGMTMTCLDTAIAQQEAEADVRKEPQEVLPVETEIRRVLTVEELPSPQESESRMQKDVEQYLRIRVPSNEGPAALTPGSTTAAGSGGVVLFGGSTDVPEDEHLETWVSRALAIYAQTDDQDSRAKQREEIAKGLNTIFEIRQQQRVKELRELEERVQKLKATLDQRAASKTEIVKSRLDYLIREADGLGWGDGIPAPKRSSPTGILYSPTPPPIDQPAGTPGEDLAVPATGPFRNL